MSESPVLVHVQYVLRVLIYFLAWKLECRNFFSGDTAVGELILLAFVLSTKLLP